MEFTEYPNEFSPLYVMLGGIEVNAEELLEFVVGLEDATRAYPMRPPETKAEVVQACERDGILAESNDGIFCTDSARRDEIEQTVRERLD